MAVLEVWRQCGATVELLFDKAPCGFAVGCGLHGGHLAVWTLAGFGCVMAWASEAFNAGDIAREGGPAFCFLGV